MNSPNTTKLTDGMDSGAVPEKVKRLLLSDGLGFCAAPECNNKIDFKKTRLGECAHIIPRKVGSHPREDYLTPLEDRKNESNLLYLCEMHHKIIDNIEYAEQYTTDIIKEWKRNHEEWAAGIKKDRPLMTPSISKGMDDLLRDFKQQFTQETNFAESIIIQLNETCESYINKELIDEAVILLSQIDLLLLDSEYHKVVLKSELLNARLLIKLENINSAKSLLLDIIKNNPVEIEPMLEYIELCESTPEPNDTNAEIEKIAREIDSQHHQIHLVNINRAIKKNEPLNDEILKFNWINDDKNNNRLLCFKAIYYGISKDYTERDNILNHWENTYPDSPRPNLFKALYKTSDILNSNPNSTSITEAIKYSEAERIKADTKDKLRIRDKISWLCSDLQLYVTHTDSKGDDESLGRILNQLFELVKHCYFDKFIDANLIYPLSVIRISIKQWKALVERIYLSNVTPSIEILELVFLQSLQHDTLKDDLNNFVKKYKYAELLNLNNALSNDDIATSANIINSIEKSNFTIIVIQSLEIEKRLKMIDLLNIDDNYKDAFFNLKIESLVIDRRDDKVFKLIENTDIKNSTESLLHSVCRAAYRNNKWNIYIPYAEEFLKKEHPETIKSDIHAKLSAAYHEQGDDTNAIKYARLALEASTLLSDDISSYMLHIVARSCILLNTPDIACELFEKYNKIKRPFPLSIEEADTYLKSTLDNKYSKCLSILIDAFINVESYDNKTFTSAFLILIELNNSKHIDIKNNDVISDNSFIKLSGIEDTWFFIGEGEKYIDANCVNKNTQNYQALINKKLTDKIEWPAHKFNGSNSQLEIIYNLTTPEYLYARAQEAMHNMAQLGNESVWSIQVLNEDGTLNNDNLKNFFESQSQPNNAYFEKYTSNPTPFMFLCKVEGSVPKGLNKIASSNKGFIYCNDGTTKNLSLQYTSANETLNGKLCTIDGFSALMLSEAELLGEVVEHIPNLAVSSSTVRFLRSLSKDIEINNSLLGRLGFIDGKITIQNRDEDNELLAKKKLLSSAELLDSLPNKYIGKTHSESDSTSRNINTILPEHAIDPFEFSQEKNTSLLTDDFLSVRLRELSEKETAPSYFSSVALIKTMAERDLVSWEKYIKYFSLLSRYRYHLLPITVDDLLKTILIKRNSVMTIQPKKLNYLNLELTLSKAYGVSEETLVSILSIFFTKLIVDNSISKEISGEIFSLVIIETFKDRDVRSIANLIYQQCNNDIKNSVWKMISSEKKLQLLKNHLSQYIKEFSPIIIQ